MEQKRKPVERGAFNWMTNRGLHEQDAELSLGMSLLLIKPRRRKQDDQDDNNPGLLPKTIRDREPPKPKLLPSRPPREKDREGGWGDSKIGINFDHKNNLGSFLERGEGK